MPTIDDVIYVALPEALRLNADTLQFRELHETLRCEAAKATSIVILGGYMSPDYVRSLCANVRRRDNGGRSGFRLRIAIGIEPSRPLAQQWNELRKLREDLRTDGFRSAEVKAVLYKGVHFHTKLFGFIRTTQPCWYVGSANPSGSKRHEMMVRVGRKHETIAAYAEAALAKAIDVSAEPPADELRTLSSFFRSGFLAHKPANSRLFTLDVFRFTPDERRKLDQGAGVRMGLRHANPTTEGYGFSLTSALGGAGLQQGDSTKSKKIKHNVYSVDTVFGFWMPRPYADRIRQDCREEEKAREDKLATIAAKLCSDKGEKEVKAAFEEYLQDMATLLRDRDINKQPDREYEERFTKFLSSRAKHLENEERRVRQARIMVLQQMPDIWSDERSANEFEESFFVDVAFRASSGGQKGRVIRSIIKGIGDVDLADPSQIRQRLENRLKKRNWTDKDWAD